ncbi:hypothetical protein [Microbacterium sp. Ru50]|uniref:hypothetical protein n=1 Tax=Microbacterium sp. Ru50 TaxID=2080744 RepID=UPI0015E1D0C3|nr:hypothetical protein [Microbacterium sp. Ru50]
MTVLSRGDGAFSARTEPELSVVRIDLGGDLGDATVHTARRGPSRRERTLAARTHP